MALATTSLATPAYGADEAYCNLYSREMVRAYIRSLPTADLANVTTDSLAFRLTQFFTSCLNRDEAPIIRDLPSDGKWVASIWSDIQRSLPHPVGSVPAEPAQPVKPPPPPTSPAPLKAAAAAATRTVKVRREPVRVATSGNQPLCSSHGMQTVYNGLHWRCQ
jgi:hypothetical protein